MKTRPRVLVAEDQTLIRLDLERLLGAAGFEVCGLARDGREAVTLALELRPDLIVLDVKMPLLDGVEAARVILGEYSVPIVMLTAYGYGEVISRALEVGAVGFVVKPFRETELIDALRQALDHAPDPAGLAYLGRPSQPPEACSIRSLREPAGVHRDDGAGHRPGAGPAEIEHHVRDLIGLDQALDGIRGEQDVVEHLG